MSYRKGLRNDRGLLCVGVCLTFIVLLLSLPGCGGGQNSPPSSTNQTTGPTSEAVQTISYSASIQPLLNNNCVKCHNSSASPAGVNLNNYAGVRATVATPPAAATSLLYQALTGSGVPSMPPSSPLSAADIQLVADWISQGALNN